MALGLSYRCDCGVNYEVYMPKRKIFGEIVNRVVDWQAADGRVTERLTCSDCTSEIDLTEYFRTRMISAV